MEEKRTWLHFVEDLVSDGRSLKHIRTVTKVTRWAEYESQIRKVAVRLRKFYKKARQPDRPTYNQDHQQPDKVKQHARMYVRTGKDKPMSKLSVPESAARELFKAMGFKTYNNWSVGRLERNINEINSVAEPFESQKLNDLLDLVLEADKVVIIPGKEAAEPVEKKPTTRKKKAAKKKTKKKAVAPPKQPTAKKKVAKKKVPPAQPAKKKAAKKKTKKKAPAEARGKRMSPHKAQVYKWFSKVKPEDAPAQVTVWHKKLKGAVAEVTLRTWVSRWRHGKDIPEDTA